MMKKEFEIILGSTVNDDEYREIELAYLQNDLFLYHTDIVEFYRTYGISGIRKLNSTINKLLKEISDLQTEIRHYKIAMTKIHNIISE